MITYLGASFNDEVLKKKNRTEFDKELSPVWVGIPDREARMNELWRLMGKDAEPKVQKENKEK